MSDSKLSLQEILSNAGALQCLLHTICKAPSKTDYEFEAKYDVYDRLMSTYNWWGYGGQMLTLTGFSLYCLRGYNTKVKLLGGALYFYWINHIFTLSAFAGVTTKLPWALETLNIDEKYETGKQIRIMNAIIRNRKNDSDNQVNSDFYKAICKTELLDSNIVQNDFFVKNQQYIPQIEPTQNTLPYFDAFVTRYIYYSFKRWLTRMGNFLGIQQ